LTVFLSLQSKIKEIRLNQEKEAENLIRLHFQMEQIVYCQDQVYKETLKTIREKEAEKEKTKALINPATFQNNSQFPQKGLTTTEMTQHLKAYYQVNAGMLPAGLPAHSLSFGVPFHIGVCV
jgi:interferon-induced GTP-binding protein Mx1